jgi:phosphatidylserine/phosphatidylglycerophosphate/cardiolipin synthase-like enzyme
MSDIEILATGPAFVKEGVRAVEPVVEGLIRNAGDEIQIAAFTLTEGARRIIGLLEEAAKKGRKVTVIVNRLSLKTSTIQGSLTMLARNYPTNTAIIDFTDPQDLDLHAKIVVVDRNIAVVGSANFSWSGMYGNYEIGIMLKGQQVWKIAKFIDILAAMGTKI